MLSPAVWSYIIRIDCKSGLSSESGLLFLCNHQPGVYERVGTSKQWLECTEYKVHLVYCTVLILSPTGALLFSWKRAKNRGTSPWVEPNPGRVRGIDSGHKRNEMGKQMWWTEKTRNLSLKPLRWILAFFLNPFLLDVADCSRGNTEESTILHWKVAPCMFQLPRCWSCDKLARTERSFLCIAIG